MGVQRLCVCVQQNNPAAVTIDSHWLDVSVKWTAMAVLLLTETVFIWEKRDDWFRVSLTRKKQANAIKIQQQKSRREKKATSLRTMTTRS